MIRRWLVIAATIVVVLGAGVVLVATARLRQSAALAERERAALAELDRAPTSATGSRTDAGTRPAAPSGPSVAEASTAPTVQDGDLLVVSRVPGDGYGEVVVVEADGRRRPVGPRCDRMHAGGGVLVCMRETGLFNADVVDLDDPDLPTLAYFGIGLPSRARVAPDGSWIAVTGFVTGHSYLDVGEFSTKTMLIDPHDPDAMRNAEALTIDADGDHYDAVEANWWGVTMRPDDPTTMLATFGTDAGVELLWVDAEAATATPFLPEGACPSISPDGRWVVYKRPVEGAPIPFSQVVRDLVTGEERVLAEDRFVDDQVEWLDDDTMLYHLRREGTPDLQPVYDIWALDIAEGATPELLIPYASSPARYLDGR